MKSFIALVVCIGLDSVSGTSINRQVISDDHGRDNDRDYTTFDDRGALITKQILETLENVHLEKKQISNIIKNIKCQNSSCGICDYELCVVATYKPETDSFDIIGSYFGAYYFGIQIAVKPWSDCGTSDMHFPEFTICETIRNVTIMDGRACADVKNSDDLCDDNTFKNVCI